MHILGTYNNMHVKMACVVGYFHTPPRTTAIQDEFGSIPSFIILGKWYSCQTYQPKSYREFIEGTSSWPFVSLWVNKECFISARPRDLVRTLAFSSQVMPSNEQKWHVCDYSEFVVRLDDDHHQAMGADWTRPTGHGVKWNFSTIARLSLSGALKLAPDIVRLL